MKMYKFRLSFLPVIAFVFGLLTSCSFSSRDNLIAYSEEPVLTNQTGTEYYLKFYLSSEPRNSAQGVLTNKDQEYGSFKLYTKDENGRSQAEGSEFWILNVKGEEGADEKIFSLAFADESGERKNIVFNRLIFHDDQSITVNFGDGFPLASNYEFTISTINDYPLPIYSPKQSSLFPFAKNYARVYLPFINGWVEWLLTGIAVFMLLYMARMRMWDIFKKMLLVFVLTLGGGIYFSWLVFIPLIVPVFITLPILLVPSMAKKARTIFLVLAIISFLYCLLRFFKMEGFWMGVWMTAYTYIFSVFLSLLVNSILEKVCPKCGHFILGTSENAAYSEAENVMSSYFNCNGDSFYDENNILSVAESNKDKSYAPICYWCIDNEFHYPDTDNGEEEDDDEDDEEEIDLDDLYVK